MSKANQKVNEVAQSQDVPNPGQFIIGPIFTPMYLAGIPLAISMTKPGGYVQTGLEAVMSLIPGGTIAKDRAIPALSAIYVFWTFGGSGAFSAAGQAMAKEDGLDTSHPRQHIHTMKGFPLRLRSAHNNLMENFPAFAVAAAMQQSINPLDQQGINLLALHVFLKVVVYYGFYLADIAPPRTMSHVLANASLIGVCWRLATGR